MTGYRCHLFRDFVKATEYIAQGRYLERGYIRERAVRLYGMSAAEIAYSEYIDRLSTLQTKGWYSE